MCEITERVEREGRVLVTDTDPRSPTISALPGGKLFRNEVEWREDGFTVPVGFIFDLSSIPWFIRWWKDRAALGFRCMKHDWLYVCRGRAPRVYEDDDLIRWRRRRVDVLFWSDMINRDGIKERTAELAYRAVRSPVGWWSWRRDPRNAQPTNVKDLLATVDIHVEEIKEVVE